MKNPTKLIGLLLALAASLVIGHLTDTGPLQAVISGLALAGAALSAVSLLRFGRVTLLQTGMLLATLLTTAQLNSAFGAEYRDGSKGLKDIRQELYHTATFDQQFTVDYTRLTVWERAISSSTAVIQNFQSGWTPNGEFEFTPSRIEMFHQKVDIELLSSEVLRSFVGFLHDEGKPQNSQELVKYIVNRHLIPQIREDNELNLAWSGEYVPHTPNTPSPVGQSMDGVAKVINAHINAGRTTPIAVGAMPSGDTDSDLKALVSYLEEFARGIDVRYRRVPMDLNVSDNTYTRFQLGMQLKYNANYAQADALDRLMLQKNIRVVPQVAMGNTTKIWCTPKSNAIKAVNPFVDGSKTPMFQFEVVDRRIKVYTHWLQGYGFWIPKILFTNDAELGSES